MIENDNDVISNTNNATTTQAVNCNDVFNQSLSRSCSVSRSSSSSPSTSSSNYRSRSSSQLDYEQRNNESENLMRDPKFLALIVQLAQSHNTNLNTVVANECKLDSKHRIVSIGSGDLLYDSEFLMDIAHLAAEHSHDPKTKVGACIVDRKHRIVGIGYNRFPVNHSDEPYPWGKSKYDPLLDKRTYVVHAEANAILGRIPVDLRGATIYSTLLPCNECAKLIIQSGIRKVYYKKTKAHEKWTYQASRRLLDGARVELQNLL